MSEEKNLPASARRRQELRDRGQVPKSQDITTAAILIAGLSGILIFGPTIGQSISQTMAESFQQMGRNSVLQNPTFVFSVMNDHSIVIISFIFLLCIAAVAAISQIAQVGFLLTDETLQPNFEKLNPLTGLKNLFSIKKLVMTFFSLIKMTLIGAFAYAAFKQLMSSDVFTRPTNVRELFVFFLEVTWSIGWRIALGIGVIALIDFLYQRYQYEKDNRMSLEEVKDETKQSEASPEMKSRRRNAWRKRKKSFKRSLEDVSDATIVITNPTHYAVALRYVRGDTSVPIVVAKGIRRNALKIREEATRWAVPTRESRELARGLFKHGEVGEPIPVIYYQAVANILAQLYRRGFKQADENENQERN
ncbi:MAG: EscU/YscU/HrcU family type III secretion system export apparatus switch protein [Verrucomicrobiota bacterium]